jgi:hypothetical protein
MRRTLLLALVLSVLSVVRPEAASADDLTPAKRADIARMLETTGALNIGRQMSSYVVRQYTESLRKLRPDIPANALATLPPVVDQVIAENLPRFADMMIPIYHKHFTHGEIRQLLVFYESEVGRKSIQVLPSLVQESMTLGQQWGQSMGPEIERRVRERLAKEGVKI